MKKLNLQVKIIYFFISFFITKASHLKLMINFIFNIYWIYEIKINETNQIITNWNKHKNYKFFISLFFEEHQANYNERYYLIL